MTLRSLMRLILPASGLLLATGLVVQSGGTMEARLTAWTTAAIRPHSSGAGDDQTGTLALDRRPRVIAEGRVVAYPGSEVVVGTEAVGRIVILDVVEKSAVRKGDLIAELYADDLKARLAEAAARVAEAEADIRLFDREVRREEALIARRAGTVQNLDVNRRGLDAARRGAAALAEEGEIKAL